MCGIFGIYGHPEAANIAYLGLHALQHRGQESAGIVTHDGKAAHIHRQMGLVHDCFPVEVLEKLPGDTAIGHVRYSTTGQSLLKNAQPFAVQYAQGSIAVAHNGNLVNAALLRRELERAGSIFQSTMDTEVIIHLFARSREGSVVDRIIDALRQVKGAYSLVFLTEEGLIAARDPQGWRPLALGDLQGATVFASETTAFDLIDAQYVREVQPGELVAVDRSGIHSMTFAEPEPACCIFEHIYFARPDSVIFGAPVHNVRRELGRQLAREHPVAADLVMAVPDSGLVAALGLAEEAGLPFETAMVRSHYVGRTFIEPTQSIRHFGVKLKLNPVRAALEGRRVIVVDDSIVRGTTSRKIVRMVREAGAKEVHLRISAPPTCYSCFYGIDTPTREELIASSHSLEEIRDYLTADSLGYLSIPGLHQAVAKVAPGGYCDACFSGNYPVPIEDLAPENQLQLFKKG